jgi:molecular chaperone GrpE
MTNEKPTDSQKSQNQSAENGAEVNASLPNEQGASDQVMPDNGSELHAEKSTINDLASEDAIFEANVESSVDEPQDPLLLMTAERDQLKDQLLRAMADTENMRRRSEREAANVRKYGHTPFARDLVGAIDNLSRAVESAPNNLEILDETTKSLITGIQLSWTELQSIIEKHGIKRVEPHGEKFDYNLHQAMFEVPTLDQPSGVVLEVVQHGYVLHDRLLRPAMVGVSKAGNPDGADIGQAKKDI